MNNLKKIIEYGLYLLVFLLPIQTRWIIKAGELNGGYSEYNTISLYATDIILFVILTFFVISRVLNPKSQTPNKSQIPNPKSQTPNYWWLIGLLELAIFISIFFAPSKMLAIHGYARFLLGAGLFWLIIAAEYNKTKLIWRLIAGAVFQAGLGVWQFLTQSSLSSKWLGMAVHNAGALGTSVIETLSGERWLRAYGGLDHPNILGGFLTIGLLLLIITSLRGATPQMRGSDEAISASRINRDCFTYLDGRFAMTIIFFTFYLLLITCLFFTFSRGAWAGFVAGLITMLAILLRQKNKAGQKKMLGILGAGVIIILILFNLYGDLALTRLSKDTRLEVKSNTERMESYKYAKEIIKRHWLFGVGVGNYTLALKNEIKSPRSPLNKGGDQPSWYYQPVHNTFLLIWAEAGILGLAGFLGLLIIMVFHSLPQMLAGENKRGRRGATLPHPQTSPHPSPSQGEGVYFSKERGHLAFSILASLVVMMLADHWFWSLHFGVIFFWLILGLMIKIQNINIKNQNDK